MSKVMILDVPVDKLDMQKATEIVKGYLQSDKPHLIVTPNAEIIMRAQQDRELLEIIQNASLVTGDGAGVVWASKIFKDPLPERITGIDLMFKILEIAQEQGYKVFLLGAAPSIAEKAAERLLNIYPKLQIVGTHHGYFDINNDHHIIELIKEKAPHVLIAAMGAPRQEKWLYRNLYTLNVPVSIGVGGSLDVIAGKVQRAPEWMQKAGLEWLFRLYKEPTRIRRMAALPKFVFAVLMQRIRKF